MNWYGSCRAIRSDCMRASLCGSFGGLQNSIPGKAEANFFIISCFVLTGGRAEEPCAVHLPQALGLEVQVQQKQEALSGLLGCPFPLSRTYSTPMALPHKGLQLDHSLISGALAICV